MRLASLVAGTCAILLCGYASAPSPRTPGSTSGSKATPLILEKNDGERRVRPSFGNLPVPLVLNGESQFGGHIWHFFRIETSLLFEIKTARFWGARRDS